MARQEVVGLAQQRTGQLQVLELIVLPASRSQPVVETYQILNYAVQPARQSFHIVRGLKGAHAKVTRICCSPKADPDQTLVLEDLPAGVAVGLATGFALRWAIDCVF